MEQAWKKFPRPLYFSIHPFIYSYAVTCQCFQDSMTSPLSLAVQVHPIVLCHFTVIHSSFSALEFVPLPISSLDVGFWHVHSLCINDILRKNASFLCPLHPCYRTDIFVYCFLHLESRWVLLTCRVQLTPYGADWIRIRTHLIFPAGCWRNQWRHSSMTS